MCTAVGFGDSLPHPGFQGTNVTKLLQTSRSDGVLLKPAHTALRLDVAPPVPNGDPRPGFERLEVWAAASVPARPSVSGYAAVGAAGLLSAATDRRANSLARLAHVNGSSDNAERWWYTLLATDTSSKPAPAVACTPMGSDGQGRLIMAGCAADTMLQLRSDGSLRAAAAPNHCLVVGASGGNELHVGVKGCATFSKPKADGTLRSGSKCLANKNGRLILVNCNDFGDAAANWTTTDSMTGSYVEHGSNKPIRIAVSKAAGHADMLEIRFVPGDAWKTARCALSASAHECIGGHFEGGSIGKAYPDCYWNATVNMPVVETAAITEGCKGCCLHTSWTKTGYLSQPGVQEMAQAGQCASICGGSQKNDTKGATITSQMLFPVRICKHRSST